MSENLYLVKIWYKYVFLWFCKPPILLAAVITTYQQNPLLCKLLIKCFKKPLFESHVCLAHNKFLGWLMSHLVSLRSLSVRSEVRICCEE